MFCLLPLLSYYNGARSGVGNFAALIFFLFFSAFFFPSFLFFYSPFLFLNRHLCTKLCFLCTPSPTSPLAVCFSFLGSRHHPNLCSLLGSPPHPRLFPL